MRYLTTRDRALRAVVKKLQGIQEPNYNFSVRHVRRQRYIAELAEDPPEIHIMLEKNYIQWRTDALIWNKLPIQIWFYIVEHNIEPDTVFNMFLGDLQRALAPWTVHDTSGTLPPGITQGREIHCTPLDDQPFYSEAREGQIVGRAWYEIFYWYKSSDPRLYDDCDSLVPLVAPPYLN